MLNSHIRCTCQVIAGAGAASGLIQSTFETRSMQELPRKGVRGIPKVECRVELSNRELSACIQCHGVAVQVIHPLACRGVQETHEVEQMLADAHKALYGKCIYQYKLTFEDHCTPTPDWLTYR